MSSRSPARYEFGLRAAMMALSLIVLVAPLQAGAAEQAGNGTISGTLFSGGGAPLANIRVAALALQESVRQPGLEARLAVAATDEQGRYRLENVPPGAYHVTAGTLLYPTYYPGSTSVDKAIPVTVRPGANIERIDFTVERPNGFRVAGRIVDEAGQSVQDVQSGVSLLFPEVFARIDRARFPAFQPRVMMTETPTGQFFASVPAAGHMKSRACLRETIRSQFRMLPACFRRRSWSGTGI